MFVAVHAGAGYHPGHVREQYEELMSAACARALACLRDGGSAEEGMPVMRMQAVLTCDSFGACAPLPALLFLQAWSARYPSWRHTHSQMPATALS